jgi:hypothetical protein
VASIAAIHNLNSITDPTHHPDVKIEMRRMYRILGRYAKQAYGINKDLLDKMVAATDDSLRGVRDRAILLLAYDSLCRRSELVSLAFEDLTINTQTSMTFVGKNYSGYGPLLAKNFLHLLENSAGPSGPLNPIQGQLWFDNSTGVSQLKVNIDGTSTGWTSAGGVKKSPSAPTVATSIQGDLWVDTVNQQLSLFTGSNWLLVGPTFSVGSQTGPKLEQIVDTLNISHTVQSIYVENNRIMIISNNSFTPKSTQSGFTQIIWFRKIERG